MRDERKYRLEQIDKNIAQYEEELNELKKHRQILLMGCYVCGRDMSSSLENVVSEKIQGDLVYIHTKCYNEYKSHIEVSKKQNNGIQITIISEGNNEQN